MRTAGQLGGSSKCINIFTFANCHIVKFFEMSKKIEFNNSLKEVTLEDLQARIDDNEMRIRKMAFAHTITPLENPMSIRALRRDVARMKTELNKRELGLA